MKLSAILPLPAAAAQHPAAVFAPIAGEPAAIRIVRALCAVAEEVIVVADTRLVDDLRVCLVGIPARISDAGESPSAAQCLAVAQCLLPDTVTHALVSDYRYPLMSPELTARVIGALADGADLVIPVLPVTDSVKVVDAHGSIMSAVDRATLQLVQYPRGATVDGLTVLDAGGADIITVTGDADAIAFDLPGDAALVEAIIACR